MKFKSRVEFVNAVQLRRDTWEEVCDLVGVGGLKDGKPEGCYISPSGYPTSDVTDTIGLLLPGCDYITVLKADDWIVVSGDGVLRHYYSMEFNSLFESVEEQTSAEGS